MSIIGRLIEQIVTVLVNVIYDMGYPGVFILMVLESAGIPIPSEIVVTFSGFLASQGYFNFWLVVFITTLANLIGSLIFYYVGYRFGNPFILKYGKYIYLTHHHLDLAKQWFEKYGDITVFIGRITPAVRTYISFPAGLGAMNLYRFIILTIIGSFIWNFILAYFGLWLGENWKVVTKYLDMIGLIAIILAITLVVYFWRQGWRL